MCKHVLLFIYTGMYDYMYEYAKTKIKQFKNIINYVLLHMT